jgi:hypothetical protein
MIITRSLPLTEGPRAILPVMGSIGLPELLMTGGAMVFVVLLVGGFAWVILRRKRDDHTS